MARQRAAGTAEFDVAIVGAGVVGTAIARELGQYDISILLLDGRDDVGDGTSKANTAILHTGYDMVTGSLEARLVRRGYELLKRHAAQVGVATEDTGALLVAWSSEEAELLPGILLRAAANGYTEAYLIDASEVYRREPKLGPGALAALVIPGEWIIDPWSTTLSYAVQAKLAGVEIQLGAKVDCIVAESSMYRLHTGRGNFEASYLVNAAGVYADEVDVKNRTDKSDTASSESGIELLRGKCAKILPDLLNEEITSIYAGLRAATDSSDYQIRAHRGQRCVTVGGIRSTGLTASMAIAEHVRDLLVQVGLVLGCASDLPAVHLPNLGEARQRPYQLDELIGADALYGEIVCHCERVTRGEIRDALAGPIPPRSTGALARRTRAGLGRCQGFYCQAELTAIMQSGGVDRQ